MLKEVDRIEVVTLIDNYVDVLLGDTDIVSRPPHHAGDQILADTLVGEHGLSLLITVYRRDSTHTVLFDTGYSSIGVPHNVAHLKLGLGGVEAIVLSHGHMDHLGSLYTLLDRMRRPMPVMVHPFAFASPRYLRKQDGRKVGLPPILRREELERRDAKIVETEHPTPICEGTILVSGEVPRTTTFETGMPNALVEQDGKLVKDRIPDDQSLFIRLKGRGLVVVGGCSHAGIVNTVLHGQKATGSARVHAVLGGFHLSGPSFEPIIDETIGALKEMGPEVVVPMHCTGWNAVRRLAEAFPSAFVLNSVGSKITLASS
jgi:7,8-dihydropterin-6-yl-methyl-4-(beta-D-ribofuranosyl)aminobenzene 5'-phosphate synthase